VEAPIFESLYDKLGSFGVLIENQNTMLAN
jgi:hypothetical protein